MLLNNPTSVETPDKTVFLRLPEIERRLPLDCQQDVAVTTLVAKRFP